jgi:hypothetical protein
VKLPTIHRIERLSFLLVAIATLMSLLLSDRTIFLGVGLGGVLAALNFVALRRLLQGILQGHNARKQAILAFLLTLKFGAIAALIYLIVRFIPVNPIALIGGISVVVLAIFVEGFRTVLSGAEATSE